MWSDVHIAAVQVWPKSGETTCRSKSVIDYLLAPVSRARYLVKDIQILPLEKKSDHNAMNFTLRRPRPVQEIPPPQEPAQGPPSQTPCSSNAASEKELRRPLLSEPVPNKAPIEPASSEAANKIGCGVQGMSEQNSPKSVIISNDEWESTSPRNLNETGTSFFRLPEWGRYERGSAEQGPSRLTGEVNCPKPMPKP